MLALISRSELFTHGIVGDLDQQQPRKLIFHARTDWIPADLDNDRVRQLLTRLHREAVGRYDTSTTTVSRAPEPVIYPKLAREALQELAPYQAHDASPSRPRPADGTLAPSNTKPMQLTESPLKTPKGSEAGTPQRYLDDQLDDTGGRAEHVDAELDIG